MCGDAAGASDTRDADVECEPIAMLPLGIAAKAQELARRRRCGAGTIRLLLSG